MVEEAKQAVGNEKITLEDKIINSITTVGIGVGVAGAALLMPFIVSGAAYALFGAKYEYERTSVQASAPASEFKNPDFRLKTEDLNGDGKPETFYEIDGVRYFSHIGSKKIVP